MTGPIVKLSALFVAGLALFAILYPRGEPMLGWKSDIDRPKAIEIAVRTLRDAGADVTGCDVWIGVQKNLDAQRFLRTRGDSSDRISPFSVLLLFTNPAKQLVARARLDWRGRVTALIVDEKLARRTGSARAPEDWIPAILKAAQADPTKLAPASVDRISPARVHQEWRMSLPTAPPTGWVLSITASDRGVVESRADFTLPAEVARQAAAARRSRRPIGIFVIVVIVALWLAAAGFAILGIVQRRLRLAAVAGGFVLLAIPRLLWLLAETKIPDNLFDPAQSTTESNPMVAVMAQPATFRMIGIFGFMVLSALVAVYLAGGLSWSRTLPDKLLALELLLRGKLTARIVGRAIAAGFALAPWPFVIRQTLVELAGPLVSVEPASGAGMLIARWPLAIAFSSPPEAILVIAFVFVYPLATLYARRAARPLALFAAFTLLVDSNDRYEPLLVAVMIALGLTLFWDLVYRRFDAATVVTAAVFGPILYDIAFLALQRPSHLQQAGASAAFLLSLIGIGGVWSALRGSEVEVPAGGALPVPTRMERERIQAELAVARRLQERMLPPAPPDIAGFDIAAICRPARQVGGDLYDFVPLPDHEYGVVVADVCGKGVGAALFMTLTKGLLRAASEDESDPVEIFNEVNSVLHGLGNRDVFVTAALAVLSPRSSRLSVVRAGHNPPLVWRRVRGQSLWMQPPGVALNLAREAMFRRVLRVEEVDLDPSDVILIYSDGLTEAMNHANEEYGADRLRTALETSGGQSAALIRDAIVSDLERFVGKTPASDDLTLVVIRRR